MIDARSLQTAAFGTRGIGRFAAAAVAGLRAALGDEKVVLLIDPALEPLPESLAGACERVRGVSEGEVGRYSVLVEPSPMTASPDPLLPLLHSTAHRIAIVYDFIPMHFPSIYLRHAVTRAEYGLALDALRQYDEYLCISSVVERELHKVLGRTSVASTVAWPEAVAQVRKVRAGSPDGPIVIMTGDEPRKNTYGALAAVGVATAGHPRDVMVVGMAGQEDRVHHWSIHAAMRPGETVTAGRLTDAELRDTLNRASVVVVPSFDEGLSLPVIEAISCGANVVASDIPAHRELIGRGSYLVNPRDLRAFARAIRRYAGTRRAFPRQQSRLLRHAHDRLERVLTERVLATLGKTTVALPASHVHVGGRRLRVGLATPWTPQRSGVADFSDTIGHALAERVDLTVYTTADARVPAPLRHAHVSQLLDRGTSSGHDIVVSVIGNSHFHTPFVDMLRSTEALAVLHDTRMVEYYLALRGPGGVAEVMLRGSSDHTLHPSLDEQIDDMRLLQNLGLWEIAQRARGVVMHAPSAAPLVEEQTGVRPFVLPFANQRVPSQSVITEGERAAARARLGWNPDTVHLGSFGYVDIRTKMSDLVVEAVAWLGQWGRPAVLHFAGAANAELTRRLTERAQSAGVEVEITGFLSEDAFRDHLLAVDAGVQLRVSPVLGVSGPLSDLAAWGTPAVASRGLATDIGAPPFIERLPDDASPLMVAEAIAELLDRRPEPHQRESERQAYLAEHTPQRYVDALMTVFEAVLK